MDESPQLMKKIDKNQLDLFGPQVWYEYLLIISPDKEVTDAIALRKQKVSSLVGSDVAYLNSIAHISMLEFLHTEHEMIIKRLKEILAKQSGFIVRLKGTDYLGPSPDSKTLVIKVSEKSLILTLTDKLKDIIGRGKKSTPHLTVVGNISSKNHQILNAQLDQIDFEGEFLCNGVTVLRRLKDSPSGVWDFKVELPFGSLITEKGKNVKQ